MSTVDVNLGGNTTTTLPDDQAAADGDVVNVTALGDSTLIVKGINVTIGNIAGVQAGSDSTFVAQNGGHITIDQGLLNVSALNSMTFDIHQDSSITLDGSSISAGSSVTNLLNSYSVDYSGNLVGTFTYKAAAVGLVSSTNFTVSGMQAGDHFDVEPAGTGTRSWSFAKTSVLAPNSSAYHDGALHITSGDGLLTEQVNVAIPMTQAQANLVLGSPSTYLNTTPGQFTFPGAVVCFAAGSLILTEDGYRPVEDLRAGDMVRTLDGGLQPVAWVGSSYLTAHGLDLQPNLRPIRIRANSFGPGLPSADLTLSPQHRIHVNGAALAEVSGAQEGLIAVKHLVGVPGVEVVGNAESVHYFHILLEEHEILFANGLGSESLYIGPYISTSLAPRHRSEIERLFPDYAQRFAGGGKTRYTLLKGRVAREVFKRHGRAAAHFIRPLHAARTVGAR